MSHESVAVVCEGSAAQVPESTAVGVPTQGVTAGAADSPAVSNKHFRTVCREAPERRRESRTAGLGLLRVGIAQSLACRQPRAAVQVVPSGHSKAAGGGGGGGSTGGGGGGSTGGGGGGGVGGPAQEADWQDAGHSSSIVVPIGSGGFSTANNCVIVCAVQVEQGPRLALLATSNCDA